MVSFVQRMDLQYQDEAPILIPKELIFQKLDKTWLQIKATSQPMIHFISGNRFGKNSSLVSSTTLQKMLKDRNAKIDQAADKEPAQNLFEGEPWSLPLSPSRSRIKISIAWWLNTEPNLQTWPSNWMPARFKPSSKSSGLRTCKLAWPRPKGLTRRRIGHDHLATCHQHKHQKGEGGCCKNDAQEWQVLACGFSRPTANH